jgi:hypothetical protein
VEKSLTRVLIDWMHDRRIVSVVAQKMGVDASNLAAKLRASKYSTRLSADDLVLLCNAIRQAGYGKELRGILHSFLEGIDERVPGAEPLDLMEHVLALTKGVSSLFDCAARIPHMSNPKEIRRLKIQLRTEVLPVVLQMEVLLDQRLKAIADTEVAQPTEQTL